jgi:uncharacterized membrane protein
MKIGKYNVHLHSISVHFTNALYPVALFFLILSYFYQRDASLSTYFHLMILATFSVPISYITGFSEWKLKYKGAKVRIFTRKQRFGLVLLGLGITCTLWYGCCPDVLRNVGGLRIVFLFLNFAILPNVIYLGYLGGKLVFGSAH